MDEIYIKVKGIWCYLYRTIDKSGNTVDFLLTKRRQRMSVQSFMIKAINNNKSPKIINIDKSGCNTSAIKVYNKRSLISQKSKNGIRSCFKHSNINSFATQ